MRLQARGLNGKGVTIMAKIFQTMTEVEQDLVLDYLNKARVVLIGRATNPERELCVDHIKSAFHHVQLAETQPL